MIYKIIAHVIHKVKHAYDEATLTKDGAKEILKVSLTELITEILEEKDKKEQDKSTPRMGFKSAGSNVGRSSTEGTED